jgi:hypothetical protein
MLVLGFVSASLAQSLTNAPAPDGAGPWDQLSDVARLGSNDVWVVGNTADDPGVETMAAHWDGTGWDVATTPNGSLEDTRLTGLAALSGTEMNAVGGELRSFTAPESLTFVLRYDGTDWTRMRTPNTTRDDNRLYDVAFADSNNGWAVGESIQTSRGHSLVMSYNGTRWRIDNSAPVARELPAPPRHRCDRRDRRVVGRIEVRTRERSRIRHPLERHRLVRGDRTGRRAVPDNTRRRRRGRVR